MVDFSERRSVNVNRPRKQGMARYFVLTALGGVLAGYGLGLTSGWFIYKPSRQELNSLRAMAEKAAKPAPVATPPPQQAPVPGPPDPNLSFYKSLPEGKAPQILGTGMNSPKPEIPAPRPPVTKPPLPAPVPSAASPGASGQTQPATRAAPPAVPQEPRDGGHREKPTASSAVAKPSVPASPPEPGADQPRKAQLKGKFVVQVASYQSKAEAEAVRGRLQDAGLPAYIVESVLKDKGTMFRVRVGKQLEHAAAEELKVKAGKDAIIILE